MLASGLAGGLLLLVVGFVLLYQVAYADRVYPGVRALGHDLGGYSREEAVTALQERLDIYARRQFTLRHQDREWTYTARELGLKADASQILEAALSVGREGNLFARFATQFGLWRHGRSFEQPGAAFDEAAQMAILERLAREIDRPAVDARLTVKSDYAVDLQPAQVGWKLDLEASRQQIRDALARPETGQVTLVVQETAPRQGDNNLPLARDQAAQILSSDIQVKHGTKSWTLDRAQLATILRFDHSPDASPAAYLDRPALENWAQSLADLVNEPPQNARFEWAGGKLEVLRPSRDGVELDVDATVDAILGAALGENREVALPAKITPAAVPMEERHNLGIKELIESARTSFAGSVPAKQENITLAAKRLNGVVVPPGGTFSFNKELGPTTLDAGFKVGWGVTIAGGNVRTVPSVAGGICQVATTLFHAVFWSGYTIEERNWHLYWIPAYTSKGVIGLDATVDEEAGLDFQFINPTQHHLLIQSWIDDGSSLNFALYGTKPDWTVTMEPSVKADVVPAETDKIYVEEEPTMPEGNRLQVERAIEGFTVTNVRRVVQGSDERTLRLVSRYRPSRNVVLVGTGGRPPSGQVVTETVRPPEAARPSPTPTAKATPAPTKTPGAASQDRDKDKDKDKDKEDKKASTGAISTPARPPVQSTATPRPR